MVIYLEITIEITDYCPNNCDYCSTNAGEFGNHLDFEEVEQFLVMAWQKHGRNINRINISGGEPLAHPDFYKILQLCYDYTDNVWVYTNALKQIIYNADIIKELKVDANVCLVPGKEIYIPKNADTVHLLQLIPQGRAKDMAPANFHVSSNIANSECDHKCANCQHILLQADKKIVEAPCKKDY